MVVTGLQHWGLTREPFGTALDPDLFFPSQDHSEAIARLEFLVRHSGSRLGLLTGEVGCGKSLTRLVFAASSGDRRAVAQVSSSHYPFTALLRAVLVQLQQVDPGPDIGEYDLMQRFCGVVTSAGRPVVVLLDEAQELDRQGLVGVRALNNLGDGAFDLTVVLFAQPEFRRTLQAVPQLDQRVGLRYHLTPLASEEVDPYLRHRLRAVGHADGGVFSLDAVAALTRFSQGVPRRVNRIADLAMALAAHHRRRTVEVDEVETVVSDLDQQLRPTPP